MADNDKWNEVQDGLKPERKIVMKVATIPVNWLDGNSWIVKMWRKLTKKENKEDER